MESITFFLVINTSLSEDGHGITRFGIGYSGASLGSHLPLLGSAKGHTQRGHLGLGYGMCNLTLGRLSDARFTTPRCVVSVLRTLNTYVP